MASQLDRKIIRPYLRRRECVFVYVWASVVFKMIIYCSTTHQIKVTSLDFCEWTFRINTTISMKTEI